MNFLNRRNEENNFNYRIQQRAQKQNKKLGDRLYQAYKSASPREYLEMRSEAIEAGLTRRQIKSGFKNRMLKDKNRSIYNSKTLPKRYRDELEEAQDLIYGDPES